MTRRLAMLSIIALVVALPSAPANAKTYGPPYGSGGYGWSHCDSDFGDVTHDATIDLNTGRVSVAASADQIAPVGCDYPIGLPEAQGRVQSFARAYMNAGLAAGGRSTIDVRATLDAITASGEYGLTGPPVAGLRRAFGAMRAKLAVVFTLGCGFKCPPQTGTYADTLLFDCSTDACTGAPDSVTLTSSISVPADARSVGVSATIEVLAEVHNGPGHARTNASATVTSIVIE